MMGHHPKSVLVKDGKIIWFFFRPYKYHCLGVLVFMFLAGLLETMNLAAIYPIINYGLNLEHKGVFLRNFEQAALFIFPADPFLVACVLLISISILTVIFKFIYNYSSNKLLAWICGDMQKQIFDKFVSADYGFYVKSHQGRLIYAGTIAPDKATNVIMSVIGLGYNLVNGAFLFSLLLLLSWQATVFIVLLGLLYGAAIKAVRQKYITPCALVTVQESQRKNVILNEFFTGIKTIKIFQAQEEWKERYTQSVDRGVINQFRMLVATFFPDTFVKFLFYMLIAGAGIWFSKQPHQNVISLLPMLGTFVLVVNRFLPSINWIGSAIMKMADCMPAARIIYEYLTEKLAHMIEGGKELVGFNDKITFEQVWFRYGNTEDYLLKGLSFSIERRKMTAIVGPSGAGKTTVVNLLLKLYQAGQGAVKIDGVNILDLNNKTYLNRIGYVSQETFIFNNSIKENIRFGLEPCTTEMIEAAAQLANADDFIKETEHGYDSIVGDSGVKLSGGQRQRIAIARAILRKPEIIIFDEATSSLDNISEKKIQKAIHDISKHTTVLVIAHRLSTVEHADKIIILAQGEIREQGTHEELLKNKKLYFDLHASNAALIQNKIG